MLRRFSLLAQGETGEICITGPQVMRGYWNREEESAAALLDGRFHTGDVGYMDEDGYTYLIDRLKEIILAGGYNIYPRHVEEAIYRHPAVEEVTVAGLVIRRQRPLAKAVFLTLEDEFGHTPVVVWPKTYERYRLVLREPLLKVWGTVSRREGTLNIVLTHAEVLDGPRHTPEARSWR